MTNIIEVKNPWHEFITDDTRCVDYGIDYEYKGHNFGHKIFTVTADSASDLPEEYIGSWRCSMSWGDFFGEMDHTDLVRVSPVEKRVTKVSWEAS